MSCLLKNHVGIKYGLPNHLPKENENDRHNVQVCHKTKPITNNCVLDVTISKQKRRRNVSFLRGDAAH